VGVNGVVDPQDGCMVARRRATYLCKRACHITVVCLPHVVQAVASQAVSIEVNRPQEVCCIVLQTGAQKEQRVLFGEAKRGECREGCLAP